MTVMLGKVQRNKDIDDEFFHLDVSFCAVGT